MLRVLAIVDSFTIPNSIILSLAGVLVGFTCLGALMLLVCLLRFIVGKTESSNATVSIDNPLVIQKPDNIPVHTQSAKNLVPAIGSIGEVSLHDVDDKVAAMLMAIVANEMKVPLNELRFISIHEVKS